MFYKIQTTKKRIEAVTFNLEQDIKGALASLVHNFEHQNIDARDDIYGEYVTKNYFLGELAEAYNFNSDGNGNVTMIVNFMDSQLFMNLMIRIIDDLEKYLEHLSLEQEIDAMDFIAGELVLVREFAEDLASGKEHFISHEEILNS